MYHDRTAWRCAIFVGKKYGSKGYPQGNAAHMGSISCMWISQLGFVTYLLNYLRILGEYTNFSRDKRSQNNV
jgi:hypothetical protein